MLRSISARIVFGLAVWIVLLATLRYRPWMFAGSPNKTGREQLTVGFLPVT